MLNAGVGDESIAAKRAAEGSAVPLREEMAGDPYRPRVFSRCGGRGVSAGVARLSADVVGGEGGWWFGVAAVRRAGGVER